MKAQELIDQLDALLGTYEDLKKRSKHDDLSDLPEENARLGARLQAAFDRMTSPSDAYGKAAEALRKSPSHVKAVELSFLAYAFKDDLKAGWLQKVTELVHAETSADILDLAHDLLDAGYKDAAAVITGTAVELHLRALAIKHGIDVNDVKGKPRKADALRIDLRKADVTSALQDKRISYWLGLRNEAAHGNYDKYTEDDVKLFHSEVMTFIGDVPA